MPDHLKRQGVHDIFHASLLQEHVPNDDRLFPGRMDTQVSDSPDTEGEWAVDHILSHAGSRMDSVFEIRWKSGDVTWLPYYQITHLQALMDYLDFLGEKHIRNLPKGTSTPPHEDPQLFVGVLSFLNHPNPAPTTSMSEYYKSQLQNTLHIPNIASFLNPTLPQYYPQSLPTLGYIHRKPMPRTRNLALCGVRHPLFTRITPTSYLMQDPDYSVHTTIHVGQIAEFLQFDEQLRAYHRTFDFTSIPIGFSEFGSTWNDGAVPGDPRRISTISLANDPHDNSVSISKHPVHLHEFHMTPAQARITTPATEQPSSALQAEINQEFAAIMVAQQRKQRQYYEEHHERKAQNFLLRPRPYLLPPTMSPSIIITGSGRTNPFLVSHPLQLPPAVPLAEELPPVDEDSENKNESLESQSILQTSPHLWKSTTRGLASLASHFTWPGGWV